MAWRLVVFQPPNVDDRCGAGAGAGSRGGGIPFWPPGMCTRVWLDDARRSFSSSLSFCFSGHLAARYLDLENSRLSPLTGTPSCFGLSILNRSESVHYVDNLGLHASCLDDKKKYIVCLMISSLCYILAPDGLFDNYP